MKTIISIASMVPLTIDPVISPAPCGLWGMRSYVPGMDTGLLREPEVNFSTSILTPRPSRVSCVAGSSSTSPAGEVTWNCAAAGLYSSFA